MDILRVKKAELPPPPGKRKQKRPSSNKITTPAMVPDSYLENDDDTGVQAGSSTGPATRAETSNNATDQSSDSDKE